MMIVVVVLVVVAVVGRRSVLICEHMLKSLELVYSNKKALVELRSR